MGVVEAILLGILQGLTEFLPVSSSGHLVLAQEAGGFQVENTLAFDVALHGGTLAAVLFYFRHDLMAMLRSLGGGKDAESQTSRRWIGLLALGSLPIAVVGLLAGDLIESGFHSVPLVGAALIVTACLLALAAGRAPGSRGAETLVPRDALIVGLFQVLGVVPGISRAGSTLVGAILRDIDRDTAARFSFLLAIPAISGAMLANMGDLVVLAKNIPGPLLAGVIAAALTGWVAIEVMMRVVRSGRLRGFALYCLIVGTAALVVG